MQKLLIYFSAAMLLALGGCSVYRPTVQQGNVLDPEALAQLRPGLSKRQVKFILGNPVLNDPFHAERWDYVYWLKPETGKATRQNLTLFFEDDTLSRMEQNDVTLPPAPQAETGENAARASQQ